MPITAKRNDQGLYTVTQGDTVIGTGTESFAKGLGATIPERSVLQTTTEPRITATKNSSVLDQKLATLSQSTGDTTTQQQQQNGISQPVATSSAGTVVNNVDNGDGTRTVTYGDGRTEKVTSMEQNGQASYTPMSETQLAMNQLDKQMKDRTAKSEADIAAQVAPLDALQTRSTAATSSLIESIKSTYAARKTIMEDTNKRLAAGKEQNELRSGRSRYTNDISEGVITKEEQDGSMRIAELDAQMLSLVAQAEQARSKEDIDIFNQKMNLLNKANDDLQTELQNMQTLSFNKLKSMRDEQAAQAQAEKAATEAMLTKSERTAPALVSQLEQFGTDEERAAFLTKYAELSGIDPSVLIGDVTLEAQKSAKSTLDMANIKSQIEDRAASLKISQQNANTSSAKLRLDQQQAKFNPTAGDKSLVMQYLSDPKNGATQEDIKRVETDPTAFYYALSKAKALEL